MQITKTKKAAHEYHEGYEPKKARCIGDTVCESPLTKQLQHLPRTSAPVPKVSVPEIKEELHPSTSRHHVSQMPPSIARLLVFKDGVTTHLCPAKQRSMKQHPLQQTYLKKESPSSSLLPALRSSFDEVFVFLACWTCCRWQTYPWQFIILTNCTSHGALFLVQCFPVHCSMSTGPGDKFHLSIGSPLMKLHW